VILSFSFFSSPFFLFSLPASSKSISYASSVELKIVNVHRVEKSKKGNGVAARSTLLVVDELTMWTHG
jgi:hypothetical protein